MALLQIGALLVVYIGYRIISGHLRERQFKVFAEQNGCKPPPNLSGSWYQAFQRIGRLMKAKDTGEDVVDDIIAEEFKEASTFQRTVFDGSTQLSTMDPQNIQALLATQFDDFATGTLRHHQFGPILGKSIFSSDGTFWQHSRALFRPSFARENINDLDATDKAADDLIAAIGDVDNNGWTKDFEMLPLLFCYTLDTATHFLFGKSVESQAANIKGLHQQEPIKQLPGNQGQQIDSAQFTEDFTTVGDYLLMRIRLFSLYWFGDGLEFRRAIRRIQHFTERFVHAAIEAAGSAKAGSEKDSLLARLAMQTKDRTELRDQTLAILLAGRDTTAGLLGWCFLRLSLHPDILTKLREVVLREFAPGDEITFSKLKSCRYLQHFLNEILRLHPTVPLNGRVATKDTTLPVGGGPDQRSPVAVKKGQGVFYAVYFMHRRKDLWGEDALEFKPERWEGKVPAWQFLPFSGGPRICLGQQFALTEASYVLVKLLQHFDAIEPVDQAEMMRMKKGLGLTMWPADGVKVRMHKA